MSTSDLVTQLDPQALGSLFVASYDSQGYGGGIGTRLHAGNVCVISNFKNDTDLIFYRNIKQKEAICTNLYNSLM
jgi:hypothetical protein